MNLIPRFSHTGAELGAKPDAFAFRKARGDVRRIIHFTLIVEAFRSVNTAQSKKRQEYLLVTSLFS